MSLPNNSTDVNAAHKTRGNLKRFGVGGLVLLSIFSVRELIKKQNAYDEVPGAGSTSLPQSPRPKTPQEPLIEATENYAEWAAKIKLPEVDIDFDATPLTSAEVADHFGDPKIDRPQLQRLYEAYSALKKKFDQQMSENENPAERQALILNFLGMLIKAYCLITGEQVPQARAFKLQEIDNWINKANNLFIPFDQWITTGRTSGLEIYGIHKILPIHVDGKPMKEVVIVLNDHKSYPVDPKNGEGHGAIGGKYDDGMPYLTVDFESGQKEIGEVVSALGYTHEEEAFKKLINAIRVAMVKHEVMHVVMTQNMGMGRKDHRATRKGDINLGAYDLKERSYTWADSSQIHELAGIGFGVMNSGDAAKATLMITAFNGERDCHFASMVAMYELLHSRYTTPEDKQEIAALLGGKSGGRKEIGTILKNIPDEEARRIGEVMAKLAMHLVQ